MDVVSMCDEIYIGLVGPDTPATPVPPDSMQKSAPLFTRLRTFEPRGSFSYRPGSIKDPRLLRLPTSVPKSGDTTPVAQLPELDLLIQRTRLTARGSIRRTSPSGREAMEREEEQEDAIARARNSMRSARSSMGGSCSTAERHRAKSECSNFSKWMQIRGAEEVKMARASTEVKQQQQEKALSIDIPSMMKVTSKKAAQKIEKDISEVRKLFVQYDEDQSGTIEFAEFLPLLSKLMRQPISVLDSSEVSRKWDEIDADGSGSITWDEFSTWYCETFGVEQISDFSSFFTDDLIPENDKLVRDVARSLGRDNVMMEKIFNEFNKLDDDGSGELEFEEFRQLMISNLSPHKDSPQVPKTVLQKFWIDVDADGSGSVSFAEFAAWYLKFFHGDTSPMEQYYSMVGTGARRGSCITNTAGRSVTSPTMTMATSSPSRRA
mmetsp:Transcript_95514/g.308028  ORF Transcript_95514/g.308028 Transcript_95514/m.308028 type:complete len:435 (-) Transcript_95514:187-1491(-)